MKYGIAVAALTLTFASLMPSAYATGVVGEAKVPHVISAKPGGNNSRFQSVGNYFFKLHVSGRSLSQLLIDLPKELRFSETVDVKDQFGRKLNATTSINAQRMAIIFAQSVPPETTLVIGIKKIEGPSNSHIWSFPVYSKLVGINDDIPLGLVLIRATNNADS